MVLSFETTTTLIKMHGELSTMINPNLAKPWLSRLIYVLETMPILSENYKVSKIQNLPPTSTSYFNMVHVLKKKHLDLQKSNNMSSIFENLPFNQPKNPSISSRENFDHPHSTDPQKSTRPSLRSAPWLGASLSKADAADGVAMVGVAAMDLEDDGNAADGNGVIWFKQPEIRRKIPSFR